MQFTWVGDYRIAYTKAGQGSPLILLHGFPTSSYLFHKMIPLLAAHFTVYALDLMGYGGSVVRPHTPIHLEAQADMVVEFARSLKLTPFTLAGHDLGGGIAQIVALEHPDCLSNIVLINSVVANNFPIGRINALLLAIQVPQVAHFLTKSPFFAVWARSRFGLQSGVFDKSSMDEAALNAFIFEPFLHSEEGIRRFLRAVQAQHENGQITRRIVIGLSEITTPTLVLWGEKDAFFSLKWPAYLKKHIPGVQQVVHIPNAGHFCPLEQPEMVARAMIQFWQTLHRQKDNRRANDS
ncbi:MAG: alpha/beta hydrolase [Anaerolineae bacterium]|nr:alpha/beta hydrolase [Anaerolineae bacterium]